MFADPSKLTPAIVRAVVNVAADPVVFWLSVATLAAASVPELILLAFKFVNAVPLRAGSVAGNLASGTVPDVKLLALKFAKSIAVHAPSPRKKDELELTLIHN